MDRRDQDNRRKIPRFSSEQVNTHFKGLLKLSRFMVGFLVSFAIYLIFILVVEGRSSLAQSMLGGGALLFTAFRLNDLNAKLKLFLENESVTNLERSTQGIAGVFLLLTFLVIFGAAVLVTVFSDYFLAPFHTLMG